MVRNDSRNGTEGFLESFRTILHTPKKASESAIGTFLPFIGIILKKRIQLFANPLSAQPRIDTSDTSTTIHTSAQKLTRKARFMSAVVRQRSVSPM